MGTFTKDDWEKYAACYDSLNELRPYSEMLEDVLATLHEVAYPLLDAGCGTGNFIVRLPKLGGKVVGIDASTAMLERARKKCRGVEFRPVNLDSRLPFEDSVFGTIVCINTLYALADPAKTLREFCRVLRPSGALVIVTPRRGYENGLILKRHCRSKKSGSYWLNMHGDRAREERLIREAIPNDELARRFLHVARFNHAIARERSFHFFTMDELSHLVNGCGYIVSKTKKTYADQNILLTATSDRKGAS